MSNGVCYVYWIHLPEHTDMFTTGYIGFTSKSVEERWETHKYTASSIVARKKNHKLYNCMNKHGHEKFIVETICIADEEYALWLENKLRPVEQIGLNVAVGGASPYIGRKHSAVTLKKMSDKLKGKKPSNETKKLMSKSQTRHKCSRSNKQVLLSAESLYNLWNESKCSAYLLAKQTGHGRTELNKLVKHFMCGWIPSKDQEHLIWCEHYLAEQRKEPNDTQPV